MSAKHVKDLGAEGVEQTEEYVNVWLPLDQPWFLHTFLPILARLQFFTRTGGRLTKEITLNIFYMTNVYNSYLPLKDVAPVVDCDRQDFAITGLAPVESCLNFTFDFTNKSLCLSLSNLLVLIRKRHDEKYQNVVGHAYGMDNRHISGAKAHQWCQAKGVSLPAILTKEDLHFLLALLKMSTDLRFTEGLFVEFPQEVS